MDSTAVLTSYPWLRNLTQKNVIMGDDLDAALSTILFLRCNPQATLAGIYSGYSKIYLCPDLSFQQLDQCVFIDLDIYKAGCRSLGHHIIRRDERDVLAGFQQSCNMNELAKRSLSANYIKKYPLGTVHFLMWLYDVPVPFFKNAEPLIWLADSTFINGQSHRFRSNVMEWLYHFMPSDDLQVSFQKIEAEQFEIQMTALQALLQEKGFNKGRGQVTSKHKLLSGYQCQPSGQENAAQMTQYIKKLLEMITEITGWKVLKEQLNIETLHLNTGIRKSGQIQQVLGKDSLDEFLLQKNVFSYVFPFKEQINYTVFN